MIVVISDLHFTDGTTSNTKKEGNKTVDLFNIKPNAFRNFFQRISEIVKGKIEKGLQISDVTFVYNGDIFDYLRTEIWFGVAKTKRPWSIPLAEKPVYDNCTKIVDETIKHNAEAFEWLSGTHKDFNKIWPKGIPVKRIYIPGNHDRIVNLYQPLKEMVREKLLGKPGKAGFKNAFVDADHKTVVMHGHEADNFNCEYKGDGFPAYKKVPIGDIMTTMLFARLGYEARIEGLPDKVVRRFRDIDNVRPALAGVLYVEDIVKDNPNCKPKINKMVRRIVKDFRATPYYKKWDKEHDKWGFDITTKLAVALTLIELMGTSIPARKIEKLSRLLEPDDSFGDWARRAINMYSGSDVRYCILGHTHTPLYLPLSIENQNEFSYLNSGTFRTTFVATFDREGFARQQRLSYVITYRPEEFSKKDKEPVYEMWSGLRKHN